MVGGIKTKDLDFELREKIIKLALLQHHKEYEHGKMGPDTFDCAGLVWYIYNSLFNINIFKDGYGLSTTTKIMTSSYGQLKIFKKDIKKDLSNIRNGDIVLFHRQSLSDNEPKINNKYPGHCGIYIGEKKFIHASRSKGKVIISNFDKNKWFDTLVGNKDIVSDKSLVKVKKFMEDNNAIDIA